MQTSELGVDVAARWPEGHMIAPCVWKTWKPTCCQMSSENESYSVLKLISVLAKAFVMTFSHTTTL